MLAPASALAPEWREGCEMAGGQWTLLQRMRGRASWVAAAVAGMVCVALPALPAGATVPATYNNASAVTVDPTGSTSTAITAINAAGVVAGYYVDNNNVQHGFVDNAGTFTTIDPADSVNTQVTAINSNG